MLTPARLAVRRESPADRHAIRGVVEAAFGRPAEADLVDALRDLGDLRLLRSGQRAPARLVNGLQYDTRID